MASQENPKSTFNLNSRSIGKLKRFDCVCSLVVSILSVMEEKTESVQGRGVGRYSRNRSIMSITNNPFEAAAASTDLQVEVLTDAVLVADASFEEVILGPLRAIRYVWLLKLWSCLLLLFTFVTVITKLVYRSLPSWRQHTSSLRHSFDLFVILPHH